MYRTYRAGAELQLGDVDEARRQHEAARDLADGIDDLQLSHQLRRNELWLLWAQGRDREAFDIAMDISRSTDMAPGLHLWWIRHVAMTANDAAMRTEFLARSQEVVESVLGTRSKHEIEALELLASGDIDQGLAAIEEHVHMWIEDDAEKEAAFLLAATAITLPVDHPRREEYAQRARDGFAKFNIDPVPHRDRL